MKRLYRLLFLACIAFGIPVSAQSSGFDATVQMPSDMWTQDIFKMGISYCNTGIQGGNTDSRMTINMRPWATKEVCIAFYNNSSENHELLVGFAEAELNAKDATIACDNNESAKDNAFYRLIDYTGDIVPVSGNGGVSVRYADFHMPKTASGNIYGCVVLFLKDGMSQSQGSMFGVKAARKYPLILHATGSLHTFGWADVIGKGYEEHRSLFRKIVIGILALWLVVNVLQTGKKKKK